MHLKIQTTNRVLLIQAFALAATAKLGPLTFAETLSAAANNPQEAAEIHIAVSNSPETFEAEHSEKGGVDPSITQGTAETVAASSVTYTYELPSGTYAIGTFHYVNLNNKMDSNLLGILKKQFGFSNNACAFFGPPDFEDAAFSEDSHALQSITL